MPICLDDGRGIFTRLQIEALQTCMFSLLEERYNMLQWLNPVCM